MPVRVQLVYSESAATLSGRQDPRAHSFLLVWNTRAWASRARPMWGVTAEGAQAPGHPFPSVKWVPCLPGLHETVYTGRTR